MSAQLVVHTADGSVQLLELADLEDWAPSHLLAAGCTSGSSQSAPPLPNWNGSASKRSIDSSSRGAVVWVVTRSLRAPSEELGGAFGGALWRDEPHDGAFAGTHGRYILQSKVERLSVMEMAA
jgi:hypothetical protein